MITELNIRGFKRFKDERFRLAPLTVLTGLNGSGKTSFLQAVLLAVEASATKFSSLPLNGPFGLELGTAEDVLNWESVSPIEIAFEHDGGHKTLWQFSIPSEEALHLEIVKPPQDVLKPFTGAPRIFTYLSAERLGPRGFGATSPLSEAELEIGVQGEYCAHLISVFGDKLIQYPDRSHPQSDQCSRRLLKYEIEQWLSEIVRPIEIAGERAPNVTVADLRFRTPGSTWVRSTNMGFGVTYALPIILAGLIAETDGLILVENPEAHLHPAGQSRMGVFLAWLAGRGVQIIIETHSDHVINGIRRAIAEFRYLDQHQAILHWFGGRRDDEQEKIFEELAIGDTGNLTKWPPGFFDQYQIDVASLGRIKRAKK